MCAGAERATGVEDNHGPVGRRLEPRRPDPQPARHDRAVELLPAILPTVLDRLGSRLRKRLADRVDALAADVDGELRRVAVAAFLEAGGRMRDEPRARDLGLGGGDDESDANEPAQRSALFRRLKKPSSPSRER
jgi:hypothetical protein